MLVYLYARSRPGPLKNPDFRSFTYSSKPHEMPLHDDLAPTDFGGIKLAVSS